MATHCSPRARPARTDPRSVAPAGCHAGSKASSIPETSPSAAQRSPSPTAAVMYTHRRTRAAHGSARPRDHRRRSALSSVPDEERARLKSAHIRRRTARAHARERTARRSRVTARSAAVALTATSSRSDGARRRLEAHRRFGARLPDGCGVSGNATSSGRQGLPCRSSI
jgi:hypothetical protein